MTIIAVFMEPKELEMVSIVSQYMTKDMKEHTLVFTTKLTQIQTALQEYTQQEMEITTWEQLSHIISSSLKRIEPV